MEIDVKANVLMSVPVPNDVYKKIMELAKDSNMKTYEIARIIICSALKN